MWRIRRIWRVSIIAGRISDTQASIGNASTEMRASAQSGRKTMHAEESPARERRSPHNCATSSLERKKTALVSGNSARNNAIRFLLEIRSDTGRQCNDRRVNDTPLRMQQRWKWYATARCSSTQFESPVYGFISFVRRSPSLRSGSLSLVQREPKHGRLVNELWKRK